MDNKTIIDTLVSNVQSRDPKLAEALRKLTNNLEQIFKTLNEGPLPAVSGENLTDIQAENIEGTIPTENLPDNIAYIDTQNQFSTFQYFYNTLVFIACLFTGGNQFFRLGTIADGDYFIGVNLFWNGAAWQQDVGVPGAALRFVNGAIQLLIYNAGLLTAFAIDVNSVLYFGQPATVTGATAGEPVLANNKHLRGPNAAATATFRLIGIDNNNIVQLGKDASAGGDGHVAIPLVPNASIPTAGGSKNGIIMIDTDNSRLVYFVNGNRYYLPIGTAF